MLGFCWKNLLGLNVWICRVFIIFLLHFIIKYLRSLGFDVNNTTFEKNSWYFRNALVRAYYQNLQKGIYKETIHLERFFRNLLMGEDNVLMNRHLHIKAKELLDGTTPTSTPTSVISESENVKRLISAIVEKQLLLPYFSENI